MVDEKEKATLIVTSVGSKREPSPGNPVITFSAHKEGEEAARGYETWGNELVDLVVKDAKLICEINQIQKGDSTIYRVTQMFDASGNPIRQARRRSSSGGSYYGKSDEQVRIERLSIEGQTAYNGIIELMKAQVLTKEDKEAKTALEFAEKKMRASLTAELPPKREEKKEPEAAAKAPPPEEKEAAAKAPPPSENEPKISDAMLEQLKKVALEKGYKQETISPLIKFFGVQQAKDLTVSQGKDLLEKIKKGEGLPKKEPPLL